MTRPHYSLRIDLVDPPRAFDGMADVEARLEVGKDSLPGEWLDERDVSFVVDFDLRFNGDFGWRPVGPAIKLEKDGSRFVYLGWYGTKDGVRSRFRRLKVPLGGIDDFMDEPRIRVAGTDAKGGPACAKATVL
jgi:hypothetical protein